MTIDITALGDALPGGGPFTRDTDVIRIPFGATTADTLLVGYQCRLMGWSIRESTGLASAVADLTDGVPGSTQFVGAISLQQSATAAEVPLVPATNEATVNTPAANGVIVGTGQVGTGNPWPIGTYQLSGAVHYAGTAGPADDFKLVEAGLATITNLECPAVANGAPAPFSLLYRKTGSSAFQVQAIAGSAGIYVASLTVTPLPGGASASDTRWLAPDGVLCEFGVGLHVVAGSVQGCIYIRR